MNHEGRALIFHVCIPCDKIFQLVPWFLPDRLAVENRWSLIYFSQLITFVMAFRSCSRSGVNQMWILKNSKELLEHLQSPNFNHITSIKSFNFSTLYTTIPHQKLKSRLATIIRNSFIHKNWNRRYKFLVLGLEAPDFVKEHSDSKNKYTEDDIIDMLEFLVDNMFVVFEGKVSNRYSAFQLAQIVPLSLVANIFLYSYEAECIQSLLSTGKKKLASQQGSRSAWFGAEIRPHSRCKIVSFPRLFTKFSQFCNLKKLREGSENHKAKYPTFSLTSDIKHVRSKQNLLSYHWVHFISAKSGNLSTSDSKVCITNFPQFWMKRCYFPQF